jgi:hypothetical protein
LDRQIVYSGSVPLETDLLNTNKNAMFALGQLCQDAFGQGVTGPFFTGLACVPNTPAAMNVVVQPGAVYAQAALDATAYSSLAADSTVTMKQGILKTAQTFATPAPVTSGQSIVYLISASFLEADTGATVLPYYNASNPAQAYSGPNNLGTSQNTLRQDTVQLTLTAGVPATTGSQTTPATPVGQTALYTVTVAYGASSVTASNIAGVFGAPKLFGFSRGLQASTLISTTGSRTLPASIAGATLNMQLSNQTLTLPSAASLPVGSRIEFVSGVAAGVVQAAGSDTISGDFVNTVTSMTLGVGDTLVLELAGPSQWYAVGGSVQLGKSASFGAFLASAGYQKLPSGLIIQWMSGGAMAPAGTLSTNWPIAFPNAVLTCTATPVGTSQGTTEIVSLTNTLVTIGEGSGTTGKSISGTRIIGIGY